MFESKNSSVCVRDGAVIRKTYVTNLRGRNDADINREPLENRTHFPHRGRPANREHDHNRHLLNAGGKKYIEEMVN